MTVPPLASLVNSNSSLLVDRSAGASTQRGSPALHSSVEFLDRRNELLPFHFYGGNEQTLVDGKEMYIDTFNRVPFSIPIALGGRAVAGLGCSG